MLEAFMYVKPAAWDAIAPAEGAPKQIWHYPYKNAIQGFWNDYTGGFTVYNVVGTQAQLEALDAQLNALDVAYKFAWDQGSGFDSLGFWDTVPAEILAVMKDHGEDSPTTPASYANPNFAHVFLGQAPRIFAGKFNDRFSEAFR